jgi:hypothetical protein
MSDVTKRERACATRRRYTPPRLAKGPVLTAITAMPASVSGLSDGGG